MIQWLLQVFTTLPFLHTFVLHRGSVAQGQSDLSSSQGSRLQPHRTSVETCRWQFTDTLLIRSDGAVWIKIQARDHYSKL